MRCTPPVPPDGRDETGRRSCGQCPLDPRRNTGDQHVVRHIAGDHAAGRDHAAGTDAHAAQDDGACTDPAAITDLDGQCRTLASTALARPDAMAAGNELDAVADVALPTDDDRGLGMGMHDHPRTEPATLANAKLPGTVDPAATAEADIVGQIDPGTAQQPAPQRKQTGGRQKNEKYIKNMSDHTNQAIAMDFLLIFEKTTTNINNEYPNKDTYGL